MDNNEKAAYGDFAKYLSLLQSTKLPSFLRTVSDEEKPHDLVIVSTIDSDNLQSASNIDYSDHIATNYSDQLSSTIYASHEVSDDSNRITSTQDSNMVKPVHNFSNTCDRKGPIKIVDAHDRNPNMRDPNSGSNSLTQFSEQTSTVTDNSKFESDYDALPSINFNTRPDNKGELNMHTGDNSEVIQILGSTIQHIDYITCGASSNLNHCETPDQKAVDMNGRNAINNIISLSKNDNNEIKHSNEIENIPQDRLENNNSLKELQAETSSSDIFNQNSNSTINDETGIITILKDIRKLEEEDDIEKIQNDICKIQHDCDSKRTLEEDEIEILQYEFGNENIKDRDSIHIKIKQIEIETILDEAGNKTSKDNGGVSTTGVADLSKIDNEVDISAIDDKEIKQMEIETILDEAGIETVNDYEAVSTTIGVADLIKIDDEVDISAIDNANIIQDNKNISLTGDETCNLKFNSFIQTKKSLISDAIVNSLLNDYFLPEKEKEEILRPVKPEKPLIAKALLPKAAKVANYITFSSNNENVKSKRNFTNNEFIEGNNETINKDEHINKLQSQKIPNKEFSSKNSISPKQDSYKSSHAYDTHNTIVELNLESKHEDEIKLARSMVELRRHSTTSYGIALKMRTLLESQKEPVEKVKFQLNEEKQEADYSEEPSIILTKDAIINNNQINCIKIEKHQSLNKSIHQEKDIKRATGKEKKIVTNINEIESSAKVVPKVIRRASSSSDAIASKILTLTSPEIKTSNSIDNKIRKNSINLPPTLPKIRHTSSNINDALIQLTNIENKELMNINPIKFEEVDSKNQSTIAKEYFKNLDIKTEMNKSQKIFTNKSFNKNEIRNNKNKITERNFDSTKTEIDFFNKKLNTLNKEDIGAMYEEEIKSETVEDIIEKYKTMSPNEKVKKNQALKQKIIPVPSITMLPGKRISESQNCTR